MVRISVIVPVFNEEEYVAQCLDSVINQSFKDIEIICVDDGSSDGSLDILRDYEEKDYRIRIITQENQGLSASRNVALDQSTGDYVFFIDSDDYLELTALEELYRISVFENVDFTISKLLNFEEKTGDIITTPYYEMTSLKKAVGNKIFNYDDVKDILFEMCVTAPGKLFKRSFIEGFEFEEGLLFEDNLFFIKCMLNANRVCFYDKYLYNRRLHSSSITKSYCNQFSDVIIIYDKIENELKAHGVYEELKVSMFNRKCRNFFLRFRQADDKQDFHNKIKRDLLSKKDEDVLARCSNRSRCIYESAVNSVTPLEFELQVSLYDSDIRNGRLDIQNKTLEAKKNLLEIKNENLKNKNDEILNSHSWKVTQPLRQFKNIFRK